MSMLRLAISALCLSLFSTYTRAGAADSSSWSIAQTSESELNNLDDHKQASGFLNSVNVVCHSIESAASDYDLPLVFLMRLIWQESRFDLDAVSPAGAQGVARGEDHTGGSPAGVRPGLGHGECRIDRLLRRRLPDHPRGRPSQIMSHRCGWWARGRRARMLPDGQRTSTVGNHGSSIARETKKTART